MSSKLKRDGYVAFLKCLTSILLLRNFKHMSRDMSLAWSISIKCVCLSTRRKTSINIILKWLAEAVHGYLPWDCISFEVQRFSQENCLLVGRDKHSHSFSHKMKGFFFSTGRSVEYGGRNSDGTVAGVLAYYIPERDVTLAVMFSVPSDQKSPKNEWKVQLYNGDSKANSEMYDKMLATSFQAGPHLGDLGYFDLRFGGFITTTYTALLDIRVF